MYLEVFESYNQINFANQQMLPVETAYKQYVEESKLCPDRVFKMQRFQQFLKEKNSYKKCDPPRKDRYRERWICINFTQCRKEWRKSHNDPDMLFEGELVEYDMTSVADE